MAAGIKKVLYFRNYFKLYEETDITVGELKKQLYSDREYQERLGITLEMVDNFWTALMDGAYEPERLNIKPQNYALY